MKRWLMLLLCLLWALPVGALTLEQDTLWTGPQVLPDTVEVPQGVTLTVASGSMIRFAQGGLVVAGRLVADGVRFTGEGWSGILLKNCDATTRISDTEIRGAATGVRVQGGTPELLRVTLKENDIGVELRGKAGGLVRDSHFLRNRKVGLFVKDESTTRISGCRFEGNDRFGAYIYRAQPVAFRDNAFSGNDTGLMIAYHGTDPTIERNRFTENSYGIQVDRAARPVLRDNLLRDNQTGIYLFRRSDPTISGNRLEGNQVGILIAYSSYPRIVGNDFVANALALKLEYQSSSWEAAKGAAARQGEVASHSAFAGEGMRTVTEEQRRADTLDGTVLATGNWWGEDGTRELTQPEGAANPSFIHDGRDQRTFSEGGQEYPLDHVVYAPWSQVPCTERQP